MIDLETDRNRLKALNLKITKAENEGDWTGLRDILAEQMLRASSGLKVPLLAFRRANGASIDARSFLDGMANSGPRTTEILAIDLESPCIAIVRSHVHMNGSTYLNIRLFIRENAESTDWRLLGWANEEVKKAGEARA